MEHDIKVEELLSLELGFEHRSPMGTTPTPSAIDFEELGTCLAIANETHGSGLQKLTTVDGNECNGQYGTVIATQLLNSLGKIGYKIVKK